MQPSQSLWGLHWAFLVAVVAALVLLGVEDIRVLVLGTVAVHQAIRLALLWVRSTLTKPENGAKPEDGAKPKRACLVDFSLVATIVVMEIFRQWDVFQTEVLWHQVLAVLGAALLLVTLFSALEDIIRRKLQGSPKD